MSYLKFYTVANESPQGKPRVFLACHPDDFRQYSGTVVKDILSTVNCAVYYMDPAESYDPDELKVDLSQMQLFVFAVTNRMLREPCVGMDELFPYAEKEHIPVLPLLQEKEVTPEEFGQRFGDLQFLSRFNITSTSISYEDQLQKYLSSVLINDDLAEKVRAAFDAYIFLSYRKKDRAYAQELMKLIHKNEFCRDVAIWYDEFLVPGENFNTAIRDMMLKSDLFVLTVTPNLVNENNYVMTTEYPGAVEYNKKIVALEMVKTDRGELEQKYKAIPACTDPRDRESLARALSDAFGRMSLREEKNSDPQHLYYIGLAYLGGIDVEVDHEKALELITRAADSRNPDAIKKLVSMYRNGEGVGRSYQKAIEKQREFVGILETVFEENEDVRSSMMYASELYELSDLYHVSKDPDRQKAALKKLISACDRYDKKWSPLYRTVAIQSLGELEADQGNYKEAKKYFLDSLEHFKKKLDQGDDAYASFAASGSILLAQLYRKYGENSEARKYCQEALDTAEKYAGSGSFKSSILSAYRILGGIAVSEGNFGAAQSSYDKIEEIYRSMEQAGYDISENLAALEHDRNALKSDRKFREDLSEIYLDYNAHLSSDYEQDRKDFLKMMERIKEKRDTRKQNISYADEADRRMAVVESIRGQAESTEIEDRREVADAYLNAAMAQQTAGQVDEAEKSYLAAYEFYAEYVKDHPDPEAVVRLVGIISGLSEVLWNRDKTNESIAYYEKCVDICNDLVENRGTVRDYELLAAAYSDLASKLKTTGNISRARDCYLDAIDAAEKMVEIDPGRHQREYLAGIYYSLAYLEVDPNNFIFGGKKPDMEALACAYDIYNQLSGEYPGDNKIMTEMNRITGSFMMNGVLLSDIDEMIANKKTVRRAKPSPEKKPDNPCRPDPPRAPERRAEEKNKKGGIFSRLFGKK
ncbi:MAG: TIR domain-containing protein [Eubacteriales bacterium]